MRSSMMIMMVLMLLTIKHYSQEDRIEFIAEGTERELDFADLTDILEYYRENPLNINQATADEIQSLQILDPIAVQNLMEYREKYGSLLTEYEMLAIEGFNKEKIQSLQPFITLQNATGDVAVQAKRRRFRFQLFGRYSRVLEQQKGYQEIPLETWQDKPNDRYIGPPDRGYVRSTLVLNNQFRMGFTLDKDAGEAFFLKELPDTIADAIKTMLPIGFDFFSAYVYTQDIRFIKKIVVGDFHLQFGQGLTMWSGMSYGKSADVTNIKRYASMIRPNTSANENSYMRGGAAWLQFGRVGIVGFYSNHNADANVIEETPDTLDNTKYISSLQESGYHRTLNEILDKQTLNIINYGGRIHYHHDHFKIGLTGHLTHFDAIMENPDQIYNHFRARGNKFINVGFDFDVLLFKNTNLFGEFTSNDKRSIAMLTGLVSILHPKVSIAMIYRHYPVDHTNLYGHGFSEGGSTQNETGIYMGISVNPLPNVTLKAYADVYRFPWLRYQVDAPSSGYDMLIQMNYILSRSVQLYLRYRTETKQQNHPDLIAFIDPLIDRTRHIIRFHIAYQVSLALQLRNRIEWNTVNPGNQTGILIYQDFIYKPPAKPYQLIARLALFDTDDYSTRIYAYENDVLYASSVPSYYGLGTRIYMMYNMRFTKYLDVWVRIAQTYYHDRNIIGTGLDQIQGRTKSEVRIQVRIKI